MDSFQDEMASVQPTSAPEEEDAVASPASPNTPGIDPRLADLPDETADNPLTPPAQDIENDVTPSQSSTTPATIDLGNPEPLADESLETLIEHLQAFARSNGFALVRSSLRRREDKTPTRLNLLCDRHGHLRNHRGLTDETRVRKKRATRGVGCPYRIAITLSPPRQQPLPPVVAAESQAQGDQHDMAVDVNLDPALQGVVATVQSSEADARLPAMYHFKVTNSLHNHESDNMGTHWKHRQLGAEEMKRIRQWYVDRKTPKEMLEELKAENPDSLYVLKDVQNARAKARMQFFEFIEGGTIKTK